MLKSISHQTAADLLHPNVRAIAVCRPVGEPIGCCGCGRRRLPLRSAERAPLGRQDLDLTCGEEMDTSFSSELSQEVSSNDGMTDMSSCNLVRESSSGACMRFPSCSLHSVWCLGCVRVFMPHRDCAGGEPSSDRHGRPKTGRESRAWRAVVAVRLSYAVACATCFQVCANCAIPALHA